MFDFNEANYENSIIELFENMGYTHVYGPDYVRPEGSITPIAPEP